MSTSPMTFDDTRTAVRTGTSPAAAAAAFVDGLTPDEAPASVGHRIDCLLELRLVEEPEADVVYAPEAAGAVEDEAIPRRGL